MAKGLRSRASARAARRATPAIPRSRSADPPSAAQYSRGDGDDGPRERRRDSAQPDFYRDWQRYFDLYNFAPVPYIRLDHNGVVEEINQACCTMLAVPLSEIRGHPLIVYVAVPSRQAFLEHMRRCRTCDVIVETEMSVVARSGKVMRVRASTRRSSVVGAPVYWTVLIDRTEEHLLNEARELAEHARAQAENEKRLGRLANDATHRFLNILSHELRTPLTPALFAASRLVENDMPERARRLGEVIRRNIQSEARLIDDLLDVSRIERGCLVLTLSVMDVHATIRDVIEAFRPQLRGKPITLDSQFHASRHLVYGDSGRIRQVLSNLVSNAIKFTDGGSVTVVTRNDESGSIRIIVHDTGIGFDTATLNDLFKSFEQHQHRANSSRGGLGLGLAICRGVIEAHEGRIWATSEGEGRGSTFEIELPSARGQSESVDQPSNEMDTESPLEGAKRMRILIVEDDDDTATVLQDLLRQDGHDLGVVHSVREAQRPVDRPWDIVISDLGLPDGSGYDVARHFGGVRPRPRLIALSGYGSATDLNATSAAGFALHLVKPIDLSQLRQALII